MLRVTHLPPDVTLFVKEICCSTLPARQRWHQQLSVTMSTANLHQPRRPLSWGCCTQTRNAGSEPG